MPEIKNGVILVGHGGVPTDFPPQLLSKLKRLEGERRKAGKPATEEELKLDQKLRNWPRSPESDPYQAGFLSLADHLRERLQNVTLAIAYNEFCAPTLETAAKGLIDSGVNHITVVPTMMTPGGSHSEIEIPEALDHLKSSYPKVEFRYAWPFDLGKIAELLLEQIHSGFQRNQSS